MIRLFLAWLFLVTVICLFMAAANGKRSLWLHLHWPTHRQRMKRAQLSLETAGYWNDPRIARHFVERAFKFCEECGCPPDVWPAGVLAIHVGVRNA